MEQSLNSWFTSLTWVKARQLFYLVRDVGTFLLLIATAIFALGFYFGQMQERAIFRSQERCPDGRVFSRSYDLRKDKESVTCRYWRMDHKPIDPKKGY